ncbi:glycosyltransferase [Brasilonema octagenarum]|uniref:4,4'-diaponeurosporenoate glycosyltransferase n=1 Tax=Brasilonema octagenarum UFV-OR1 TaxID=417115 RepID=A0ABX1LZ62_9CYAN|nr:glycosyltransferase family A protein [Brasilonema octagenarum]NMF61502.1 glycosyltransferase family 2 protein [Brasilonema octagenarum UFV-OR1]
MQSIGVVVIGRNEGNRLQACLRSVIGKGTSVVYVDSGSTDGSVALARSLGVHVIELDLSIPFTAARARNTGFEHLLQIQPELEFVQFVDGDCRVVEGWLERAVNELVAKPDVVVVCGRRREEFPTNSIYNRLCDIEWNTPIGEAKACGGDSMMRAIAFKKVGGFNPTLIAGEEPELCVRLRQARGKILRIDAEMTSHDAQITRFRQWWKREIRNGHAYAEGAWLHGGSPERHWVRESLRSWLWGLLLPVLTLASLLPTRGLSILLLLIAYTLLGYRVYRLARFKGFEKKDALFYALFCGVLEKYPKLLGQIQFHINRLLKRQRTLVEYKSAPSVS